MGQALDCSRGHTCVPPLGLTCVPALGLFQGATQAQGGTEVPHMVPERVLKVDGPHGPMVGGTEVPHMVPVARFVSQGRPWP